MEQKTITLNELREAGVGSWSVKDNSVRGITTKYTSEVVVGDQVVIGNRFTLVTEEQESEEAEQTKCDFCGRTSVPENQVTDFNGWVLCSTCWLTDPRALDRPRKEISIDNGLTFIEPEEAIEEKDWEVITHYMEDEAREKVHNELAPCTDLAFLIRYLEVAENDLVIG